MDSNRQPAFWSADENFLGVVEGVHLTVRFLPNGNLAKEQKVWLRELQAARGLMMYEPDVRPWFRRPDGSYLDAQNLDCGSYHGVARNQAGEIIGCIRQTPSESTHGSQVLALLGDKIASDILWRMGNPQPDAGMEGGRLCVHPDHRRQGLAFLLIAMGIAAAKALGRSYVWGFVGTRIAQNKIFERLGYQDLDYACDWSHVGEVARLMWCDLTKTSYASDSLVMNIQGLIQRGADANSFDREGSGMTSVAQ